MKNSLNISDNILKMFTDRKLIDSEESYFMSLEKYKYISRNIVLEKLRSLYSTLNFVSLESSTVEETFRRVSSSVDSCLLFESIENPSACLIVSKDYSTERAKGLQFEIYPKTAKTVYVSPYNFLELEGLEIKFDAAVVLRRLILECTRRNSSDLHIKAVYKSMEESHLITYRSFDSVVEQDLFPVTKDLHKRIVVELIEKDTIARVDDLTSIGGVTTSKSDILGDGEYTLRIKASKTIVDYYCALRIHSKKHINKLPDQLGFDEKIVNAISAASSRIGGLFLLTGGPNTGKSTTAYSVSNILHRRGQNIMEISSPPEVLMPYPQKDYSESLTDLIDAVTGAKKEDLDVVIVNELANSEVAYSCVNLVNSSIKVLTTTHINRIWNLTTKLEEFFKDKYKSVIQQLDIVLNQRMFRTQCKECSFEILVDSVKDEKIRETLFKYGVEKVLDNRGCSKCKLTPLQPYGEFILFDHEIVGNMISASTIYGSEEYIRKLVFEREQNLEYFVCKDIKKYKLHYSSLSQII